MSFPPLVLAIAVVAVLGPSLTHAMIAVGIGFAPGFFRLTRAATLEVREETYTEAARSMGVSTFDIVRLHVLPNIRGALVVYTALTAGRAMLIEASLSYLGLSVQPPQASWGSMLSEAFNYINQDPMLSVVPGLAIAASVLAFNLLGDGIRDTLSSQRRAS
jgi:ABC-type dipeptide/oligopeptide/nickel transport system permease subunit